MIVHVAGFSGDKLRMIDIWETAEQEERFRSERCFPRSARLPAQPAEHRGRRLRTAPRRRAGITQTRSRGRIGTKLRSGRFFVANACAPPRAAAP